MNLIDKFRIPFEGVLMPLFDKGVLLTYIIIFILKFSLFFIKERGPADCDVSNTICHDILTTMTEFVTNIYDFSIILFWFYVAFSAGRRAKRLNDKFSPIAGIPILATIIVFYLLVLIFKFLNVASSHATTPRNEPLKDFILIDLRRFLSGFKYSANLETSIILGYTSGII